MSQNNGHPDLWETPQHIAWRTALLDGDVAMVKDVMKAGIPADFPLDPLARLPLVDIALLTPINAEHAEALRKTARLLINCGTPLNMPDYKGLVPADYALISPNRLLARDVVISTLHNEIRKNLAHSYKPRLSLIFSMIVPEQQRLNAHNHITQNIAAIRQSLQKRHLTNDPLLLLHSRQTLDFWRKLHIPSMGALEKPSSQMRQAFDAIARAQEQLEHQSNKAKDAQAEELDGLQTEYRLLEWQHAQALRGLTPSEP